MSGYTLHQNFVSSTPVSNRVDTIYTASAGAVTSWSLTAATNTSLGTPGGAGDDTVFLAYFADNLYAMWVNAAETDVGIARWVSGTTWTQVWSPANCDLTFGAAGGIWAIPNVGLVALVNVSFSGNLVVGAVYSSDGSSWNNGTVDNTEALFLVRSAGAVLVQGTIYLKGSTEHLNPLADAYLWSWSTSNWTQGAAFGSMFSGTPYPQLVAAASDKFWRADSATTSSYSDNLTSWTTTPDNSSSIDMFPVYTIDMPWSIGDWAAGVAALQRWLDASSEWDDDLQYFDGWNGTLYGSAALAMLRVSNGDTFLVTFKSPASYFLLQRNDAYPTFDPSGTIQRLWIYKTEDAGANWSSRGVKT